jgi:hypothetical protein
MKYQPCIVTAYFRAEKIPEPVYEYRFHPERKWRLDLAWPASKLAIEVQGGIWIQGRHNRGAALKKEWEKLNTLAVMGWRVLYCEPRDLCTNDMVKTIKEAL